jgi:hypothetical protein
VIGTFDGSKKSTTGRRAVGSGVAWGGSFIDRVFSWGLLFAFAFIADDRLLVGDL